MMYLESFFPKKKGGLEVNWPEARDEEKKRREGRK